MKKLYTFFILPPIVQKSNLFCSRVMTAGYVTGEQKNDDRFKIGGRAFGGNLWENPQPTTRTVHTHVQPHKPLAHSPYTCDNGGTWNYSLQRCDCLDGFVGKTLTVIRAQKHILNKKNI